MDQSELDDMDLTSRVEEIEALTAIYPGDIEVKEDEMIPLTNGEWKLHKQRGAIMTIYSNDEDRANSATLSVRLDVLTPPDYPSRSAPTYRLFAPFLRGKEKEKLIISLDNRYADNPGECILFDWIEMIKEHIQHVETSHHSNVISDDLFEAVIANQSNKNTKPDEMALAISIQNCDISESKKTNKNTTTMTDIICPEIFTGDTIEDRKSVFQGHFASVNEVQQVPLVLEKLRENKKIKNAHHPTMYAYRIQQKGKAGYFQDCDDDGESGAGSRLLHLLNMMDVNDTLVVVTRWYGGTHLGGDRWKHINNVARNAIEGGMELKAVQEKKNDAKSKSSNRGKNTKRHL